MTTATGPSESSSIDNIESLTPDSLLWQNLGEWTSYFAAAPASLIQVMHPQLGAGVDQHSEYEKDPYGRLFRSVDFLVATVYGADPHAAAKRIRDFHHDVKGVDHTGARYHALDPELYYWAHATFVNAALTAAELRGGLNEEEKERLYEETKIWYRLYGVSDRAMPADYAAFQTYFQHALDNVLEATPAARTFLQTVDRIPMIPPPYCPALIWRIFSPFALTAYRSISFGLIPPAARMKMNIKWNRFDELRFRASLVVIQKTWPRLPARLRQMPQAYNANRRIAETA